MKKIILLSLITFLTLGCGNNKLTRSEAAKLIKNQIPDKNIEKRVQFNNDEDVLAAFGYLTWRKVERRLLAGGSYRTDYQLKGDARNYLIKESGNGRSKKYLFNLGTIRFGEVTGILQKPETNEAIVEYTIEYKTNDFAKKVGWEIDKIETKKANFKRFDDGWRATISR